MTPTTFLMIWVVHARTQTSNFSLILQFERNPGLMGLVFLERWRGKKVMFVGDSLSLNVAITGLDCMIHSSVPNLILFPELREKSATDDRRKISNYHRLKKNRSSMDIVSLLDNSISDVCGSSVFLSLLTIVTVCIGLPRITTNNPSFSFPIPKKPNQN